MCFYLLADAGELQLLASFASVCAVPCNMAEEYSHMWLYSDGTQIS